jgi:hypothetical protein
VLAMASLAQLAQRLRELRAQWPAERSAHRQLAEGLDVSKSAGLRPDDEVTDWQYQWQGPDGAESWWPAMPFVLRRPLVSHRESAPPVARRAGPAG